MKILNMFSKVTKVIIIKLKSIIKADVYQA